MHQNDRRNLKRIARGFGCILAIVLSIAVLVIGWWLYGLIMDMAKPI